MAVIRFVRVAQETRSTVAQTHARAIRFEDKIPEMKLHDRNKSIKRIEDLPMYSLPSRNNLKHYLQTWTRNQNQLGKNSPRKYEMPGFNKPRLFILPAALRFRKQPSSLVTNTTSPNLNLFIPPSKARQKPRAPKADFQEISTARRRISEASC
jgi:hypothetical protein